MDLSLLRGFAAGVRVELGGVVGARLAGVLLPGSVERVEFPEAVRRLEGVVARSGRDVVVEQVAYTWFNRLVALRFMDVNGYTGVGVVSPAGGVVAGQPEVLADAKAGHVDAGVVGEKVRDRVIGLLSGSVVSRDGQGEAFKLLLAAYCNHWAGPMPFMFERSGDFTELLVPDDLLSDRSIVARIVRTLTPEVCSDVEVIGWLYQFYIAARKDEVFAGFKKNKKATALEIPAATQLFTPHWIVKYLVENSLGRLWLLNNPGSDLASRMEYYIAPVEPETDFLRISGPEELKVLDPACGSGHMLTYAFDLLFLMYEEAGYARSEIPGLILKHNLFGAEIDPRAGALAAFALAMKARGKQKSFLNPGKGTAPNICVLEPVRFTADELETLLTRGGDKHAEIAFWQAFEDADTFGSLIRPNQDLIEPLKAHVESLGEAQTLFGGDVLDRARTVLRQSEYLSTRYHVAVANPPYMGSGNMGPKLAQFAKREYPDSKSDLFAMFIERCISASVNQGLTAMITMHAWMFLSSYANLRTDLLQKRSLVSMVHLGPRAFNSIQGEVVAATSFVVSNEASRMLPALFIRAVAGGSEDEKQDVLRQSLDGVSPSTAFLISPKSFLTIPGSPFVYWIPENEVGLFTKFPALGGSSVVRKGLVTLDDARFTRRWFEVSRSSIALGCIDAAEAMASERRWVPLNKGGGFRKWYGYNDTVIDWKDNGQALKDSIVQKYGGGSYTKEIRSEEYYFRPCITWGAVSTGLPSFRYSPPGSIFSSGGSCLFPQSDVLETLSVLNSSLISDLLQTMTPTMNYVSGDVARLPRAAQAGDTELARELVNMAKEDWDAKERSWEFQRPDLLRTEGKRASLADTVESVQEQNAELSARMLALELANDRANALTYGVPPRGGDRHIGGVTIDRNVHFSFSGVHDPLQADVVEQVKQLTSYAVGCMFGRYSLDVPGLVLADQGDTLSEYLAKVPSPSFVPDEDNVLPVLSDSWFEDDVVERFREFLKVSFGEETFEENLRFVEDALGKDIRKYFVQDFYKDHVQRYKKRPIYWMFSSPKGSFSALIYMHRYRPDMVSVVLNDYLHEFQAKLRARRANLDQVAVSTLSTVKEQTAARKEAEQIDKMLLELEEWEQSVLYPLATEQIAIDLDDGVKVNYPKFGTALKKIVGMEANE
ncbi:BREX-1 system adenine-specific DNA-methyltransferase PglX [Arthrobacter sp. ZGTC131]|uniref:BREX-1 system adenine-specific DNA-methyltransferase PglX n=1 Tax=Arthrobacter sp. ZGTC131 TaxID=2058898 RepID=UPI000CE55F7D|nr:BREX-1 system adenine-specific DNA-methyltransferase PglX [Arthrobacter sp. ZGTC131]